METNPLLLPYDSPKFHDMKNISEANCFYGFGKTILDWEAHLRQFEERCIAGVMDFDQLIGPLDAAKCQIECVMGIVGLFGIVAPAKLNVDRFSKLENRALQAMGRRHDSQYIFDHLVKVEKTDLSPSQRRIINRYLSNYKHNGFYLNDERKVFELRSIFDRKIAGELNDYNFRMMKNNERFRHTIDDPSLVKSFPVDVLKIISHDRAQPSKGPWTITLFPYIYKQFMAYCPSRQLRYNAHYAEVVRGSKAYDNHTSIQAQVKEIRKYRRYYGQLLGYDSFSQMCMDRKMAGTVDNVEAMITNLSGKAKAGQEVELESLQSFALSQGLDEEIEVHDVEYYKRKQRRSILGMSDDDLRDYFPLPKVMKGVFKIYSSLFNIDFKEINDPVGTWNPQVQMFQVSDKQNGQVLGHFYLDLFIRDDKGYLGGDVGQYMNFRNSSKFGPSMPIGALVMSLMPANYGRPSLLNFSETEEFIKQIGHVMQHILCRSDYNDNSINGLEEDVFKFFPIFMTHW